MDKATELIKSLSEEEIAAYAASSSDDPHIVIGRDRVITVPIALKRIGVQNDHQVNRLVFDCPRYWNGLDFAGLKPNPLTLDADGWARFSKPAHEVMYTLWRVEGDESVEVSTIVMGNEWDFSSSITDGDYYVTCVAYDADYQVIGTYDSRDTGPRFIFHINYANYDRTASGRYTVDDVSVDENDANTIHFSLPITKAMTHAGGWIDISVHCEEDVDEEFVTRWNSEPCGDALFVDPGLECMEAMFESYPEVMDQMQRTAERLDTSSEELLNKRLDDILLDQDALQPKIYANVVALEAETEARLAEDTDISDSLDADITARESADAAISERIDNLNIEVQDIAYSELKAMVEQVTEKSYECKTLYRPYRHVVISAVDGMEIKYYYRNVHRGDKAKCFDGAVTMYGDNRFHLSFNLSIKPGANPGSAASLADETKDIVTREDLSRFIFGHNRACFSDLRGFWYPVEDYTDFTDSYSELDGGKLTSYLPDKAKVPVIGAQVNADEVPLYSRENLWVFMAPGATINPPDTDKFYESLMFQRLGPADGNIKLGEHESDNLYFHVELEGQIENENYFPAYSEYIPSDMSIISQDLRSAITLNGVGNPVTLKNMYWEDDSYAPSYSSSDGCEIHTTGPNTFGDYCTINIYAANGKRAFLFEDDVLVATAIVENHSLHFSWAGYTKTLEVAYSYTSGGSTKYDYWRYANGDQSEQTSKPLTVIFEN